MFRYFVEVFSRKFMICYNPRLQLFVHIRECMLTSKNGLHTVMIKQPTAKFGSASSLPYR